MESIISGLTRASTTVPEPSKAKLLSMLAELRKLKFATAEIIKQLKIEEEDEVALQEFIGQLDAISSVAEQPLSTWLGEVGQALMYLGDVMAMPPPALPQLRQGIEIVIPSFETSISRFESPADEEQEVPTMLGVVQNASQLDPKDRISDHESLLQPGFFTSGTQEEPIELSDSPIIKREHGAEDDELPPLELMTIPKTGSLAPFPTNHESLSTRNFPLGAATTHSKGLAIPSAHKPNDHHGGVTIGRPTQCERCNEQFPSKKRMLAHFRQKHWDQSYPFRKTTGLNRAGEETENDHLSPAEQQDKRGRKRNRSESGRDQRWKRGRGRL